MFGRQMDVCNMCIRSLAESPGSDGTRQTMRWCSWTKHQPPVTESAPLPPALRKEPQVHGPPTTSSRLKTPSTGNEAVWSFQAYIHSARRFSPSYILDTRFRPSKSKTSGSPGELPLRAPDRPASQDRARNDRRRCMTVIRTSYNVLMAC